MRRRGDPWRNTRRWWASRRHTRNRYTGAGNERPNELRMLARWNALAMRYGTRFREMPGLSVGVFGATTTIAGIRFSLIFFDPWLPPDQLEDKVHRQFEGFATLTGH